jgi:hypothetical protein
VLDVLLEALTVDGAGLGVVVVDVVPPANEFAGFWYEVV